MLLEDAVMIIAVFTAVGLAYFPKLNTWFKNIGVGPRGEDDGNAKRRIIIYWLTAWTVLFSIMAVFGWAIAYQGILIIAILRALLWGFIVNQGVYAILPRVAKRLPMRARRPPKDQARG